MKNLIQKTATVLIAIPGIVFVCIGLVFITGWLELNKVFVSAVFLVFGLLFLAAAFNFKKLTDGLKISRD